MQDYEKDLETLYMYITKEHQRLGQLYAVAEGGGSDEDKALCAQLLDVAGLEPRTENIVAVLGRVVGLRDESLVQALVQAGKSEEEITQTKHAMYEVVREVYHARHEAVLYFVEDNALLDAFYRRLLWGVHEVGVALSAWQPRWTRMIIEGVNERLKKRYGTTGAVVAMLAQNGLLEKDGKGDADRSYSVLVEDGEGGYESLAYAEGFPEEVAAVAAALDALIEDLENLEDTLFDQKEAWLTYFEALRLAFTETHTRQLIPLWQNVDRAWMHITTPLQVGHPLEYYEDHYKKAVALEWDVRLCNPKALREVKVKASVKRMYARAFAPFLTPATQNVYEKSLANLERVQLYLGRPALFYGAELNGLFSAQVVPNDETVSQALGKKIFAFADNVLDSARAKPFLEIQRDVLGKAFMHEERTVMFRQEALWHRVYEVSTIGHEFGHVLWMDETTEAVMNADGMFKNIEEFKATLGGLVAFFEEDEEALRAPLLRDTIKRSVGLIGWMKTPEVQPYYCEGLMHLHGLFESGVLHFDGALHVRMEHYEKAKQWYQTCYQSLGEHYVAKRLAGEFLNRYVVLDETGVFVPKAQEVRAFVEYYWALYCLKGRTIDTEENRADWM
ncbi:MAG: invasion protein CiaB [Campylobacterales bacterium]|nr:invasion protein CiaB [Campylobacterales bacterium]